jgi:NAD(P)-dependent dehydrogenase (short-subunit alcohol dehydrogenase family)
MQQVLITGADRGVGFGLCQVFLENGWRVYAGRFMPDWHELDELQPRYPKLLCCIPLNVADTASVAEAYTHISTQTDALDMLINNAGVSGGIGDIFELAPAEKGMASFLVNCLGAIRVTETFLPLLSSSGLKRLCFVSSEAGSVSVCHRDSGFTYPMSKTALNMAVRILHNELYPKGFTFRLYHPGWVRSYMSGKKSEQGLFEPYETAASAYKFFTEPLKREDTLRLIDNAYSVWPF